MLSASAKGILIKCKKGITISKLLVNNNADSLKTWD